MAELIEKGQPVGVADPGGYRSSLFDGSFPLPTAVLLDTALEHNVAVMARYCATNGVLLAPHGKTTMCPQIISRQLAAGAWAVTAATAWQVSRLAAMAAHRILLANELVDLGSIRLVGQVLDENPELELYCYVDSRDGLDLLERGIPAASRDRVRLLVEIGVPGGRTGLRDDAEACELARTVADSRLGLHGLAAFEGVVRGTGSAGPLPVIDELLNRLVQLVSTAWCEGLFATSQPIVTAGGSAYFDRVVAAMAAVPEGCRVVLRSGCYVTHDHGAYKAQSPLRSTSDPFRPALEVWAVVLSRPEPGLTIIGLGRRDVATDAGLPVPLWVRSPEGANRPADARFRVVATDDQHAYLQTPADVILRVGEMVGVGISHPCTTFDKWRAIPIVDDEYTVVDVARTYF